MKPWAVEEVSRLASEVVELANAVKEEAKGSGAHVHGRADVWAKGRVVAPSKYVAALRRRSLDLTRALAEMRKP